MENQFEPVPRSLAGVSTDDLYAELESRGREFIQLIPLELMLEELLRRNPSLSDIIRACSQQNSGTGRATDSEEGGLRDPLRNGPPRTGVQMPDASLDELTIHDPIKGSTKGKIDIKQRSVTELAKIAYDRQLISKAEFEDLKSHKTPSSPKHPQLAYKIAAKLPNLFYVSTAKNPFTHYTGKEGRKLRVLYHLFRTSRSSEIEKWNKQAEQGLQQLNLSGEHSEGFDIRTYFPSFYATNEDDEQSFDEEDRAFIVDESEESIDRAIEEINRQEKRERKRRRQQALEENTAPSKKKSKMLIGSDSEEDQYELPSSPMKKLHRTEDDQNS